VIAMRASRLLSIMMLLQTRGRMSAPALAAQLEVSQRTILRDMDHLSASGVPVWSDRGRDGGFQLQAGWTTQLNGFTEAEAQALFLAGLPTAATELGLGGASASAQLKMLSALPAALQADAQRVRARLHVDSMDWFRAASPPMHLQAIADAVWNQRSVDMHYDSWTGVKRHTAWPLGLVLKAGVWYMVAQAPTHTEPRTYKLASITQLTVQTDSFKRPKNFDLAVFWRAATQRFEANIYTSSAQLRVTRQGLQKVCAISPSINLAAHETLQADAQDSQWSHITVPIESIDHAAQQLWALSAQVEVLAPKALRTKMKALLQQVHALYD
jgi:predicted DNA-binding transcriptional regulator YafY